MSLTTVGRPLPPTSFLPPVRSLEGLPEEQIASALRQLHVLYCPLRVPLGAAVQSRKTTTGLPSDPPTPPVDSGYASRNDSDCESDSGADGDDDDVAEGIRADALERQFAIRWLTAFIAHAEALPLLSEDACTRHLDTAAGVLASFSAAEDSDADEDPGIVRDFRFPLDAHVTDGEQDEEAKREVFVQLNDAPLPGTDHTAVGLQSWGGGIVLSSLMCASPSRFGLASSSSAPSSSPLRVVELGAGTGLVSLTLAALVPQLPHAAKPTTVATDYHPAVLANLRANVRTNYPSSSSSSSSSDGGDADADADAPPVQTCLLDWSAPDLAQPTLAPALPADVLVAADVVYAPEHAAWLRDCAARMLGPRGVFWLIATVRPAGKFEGIVETVERAFARAEDECPRGEDGRVLRIMEQSWVEKLRGVGRGDELGYKLFRIGWA